MAFIEELRLLGALLIVAGFGLCAWFLYALKLSATERNARRLRQVKRDGHAAAAEHGLGAFVSLRQTEWSVPGDSHSEYLAVLAFLVVLATPPGAMLTGRAALWWLGVLVSVVGMVAGWLSARWLRMQTARYVLCYEQGFVFRSEKAVHAFRWADIAEVRQTTKKQTYHGHHYVIKFYYLRAIDGRRARVKGEEFGSVALSKVPAPKPAPSAGVAPAWAAAGAAVRPAATEAILRSAADAARPAPAAPAAKATPPAPAGRGTVPPRIAEAASRLGLGAPRGAVADTIRIVVLMVIFSAVAPPIGISAVAILGGPVGPAGSLLTLTFIALVASPIWAARSTAHTRRGRCTCYLYTGGLILTGLLGRVRAVAAWDDVACVYWQQRSGTTYRRSPASAFQLWVLRRGQPALSIHTSDKLGQELIRLHAAAALPGLTARLAAGETLRFGPFRMGAAGVDDGAGTVPWDEITGCDSTRDRVGIIRRGQPRPVRVARKRIPDVLLFEQLIRAFAGRPWTGAPAAQVMVTGPGDGHTVRDGWRERLLTALTPLAISRLAVVLGGGTVIALLVLLRYALPPDRDIRQGMLVVSVIYTPVAAALAYGLFSAALWRVVRSVMSALAAGRPPARRGRLAAGALTAAGIVLWLVVWLAGPGAVTVAVLTALPALLVFALGGWIFLLTQRRVRFWRHRWPRHLADVPAAAAVAIGILLLCRRDLLADQPAAVVFFPLGAWCAIWIWRAMGRSPRLPVRAGADLVLSLLLGADLVLFAVWAANVFGLSEPEVAVLRGVLERVGAVADLPWWLWLGLLIPLAGASLAFAIWPGRLRRAIRWSGRLHVVPAVDVGKRLLTGVHIGLLVIVMVGMSAPPSLDAALRGPLRASYTVTVQRELEGHGERAAYTAIQRQFSSGHGRTPAVGTLTAVVSQIHSISPPPPGSSGATSTEDDLARHIGQIQAAALGLISPRQVHDAAVTAAVTAGLAAPAGDTSDLSERVSQLSGQQRQARTVARQVDQAGELAAAAVASTISIPGVGDNEIVQVIREYLSGLIEDSPLKDVFAAWSARLVSRLSPPSATTMVVPDPVQLEDAATIALTDERAKEGLTGPAATDPATLTESAIATAVELANQARLVGEGSGSCYECAQAPGAPDQPAEDQPVENEPVEPHDDVP